LGPTLDLAREDFIWSSGEAAWFASPNADDSPRVVFPFLRFPLLTGLRRAASRGHHLTPTHLFHLRSSGLDHSRRGSLEAWRAETLKPLHPQDDSCE
jgi:hypothetical protein